MQLWKKRALKQSEKTDQLKGVTQPPLGSHVAPSYDNFTFDKGKKIMLSYLHFSLWSVKIKELTSLNRITLTWWNSSVKITANWGAEDKELLDSSTGWQPRRLLMYWLAGLWNAYNLCHTFISFLLLSPISIRPRSPTSKQALVYCWTSFNQLLFVYGYPIDMGQHKDINAINWHFTSQLGFLNLLHCLCLKMNLKNILCEKLTPEITAEHVYNCFDEVQTYKI